MEEGNYIIHCLCGQHLPSALENFPLGATGQQKPPSESRAAALLLCRGHTSKTTGAARSRRPCRAGMNRVLYCSMDVGGHCSVWENTTIFQVMFSNSTVHNKLKLFPYFVTFITLAHLKGIYEVFKKKPNG